MSVRATAPGKLVLLGEYAVLEGAPAVVMAADRRAEVIVAPASGPRCRVRATNLGAEAEFTVLGDGRLDWAQGDAVQADRFGVLASVVRELVQAGVASAADLGAFETRITTSQFYQRGANGTGDKLGLGSSAALTVALAAALSAHASGELNGGSPGLDIALRAHRGFQRGSGSGLDVAASLHGGVVSYRLRSGGRSPEIRNLSLPAGIEMLCVSAGKGASTREYLERIALWRRRAPEVAAAALEELSELAQAGLDAVESADTSRFLFVVSAFAAALQSFREAADVDIMSAEHRAIEGVVRAGGGVYKPSGAGGGDIGLAFSDDAGRLERLAEDLARAGFASFVPGIDSTGVQTSRSTE